MPTQPPSVDSPSSVLTVSICPALPRFRWRVCLLLPPQADTPCDNRLGWLATGGARERADPLWLGLAWTWPAWPCRRRRRALCRRVVGQHGGTAPAWSAQTPISVETFNHRIPIKLAPEEPRLDDRSINDADQCMWDLPHIRATFRAGRIRASWRALNTTCGAAPAKRFDPPRRTSTTDASFGCKSTIPAGVDRSLPTRRENSRNSRVVSTDAMHARIGRVGPTTADAEESGQRRRAAGAQRSAQHIDAARCKVGLLFHSRRC